MRRVVFFILSFSLLLLVGTSSLAATSTIDIDSSESDRGIVKVKFNTGSEKKIKLRVALGDTKYYYNLSNGEDYVNFPLQFGDGTYSVAILENTTGTKYRYLHKESFVVDTSEEDVYLNSIQEIDWDIEDEAIALANLLVEEALEEKIEAAKEDTKKDVYEDDIALSDEEVTALMYDYVVENIKYDYQKIKSLEYNYLPDIDETLESGKGICYDYSSLLASMLRSQGIQTKLVKGYTTWTSVYHAWNEVYIEEEDRWAIVDTTYDSYMYLRKRDYSFEKDEDVYNKKKEF